MALNSSSSPCFGVFLILTVYFLASVSSSSSNPPVIKYSDHCSSDVPESSPVLRVRHSELVPYIYTSMSYSHGGDSLWARNSKARARARVSNISTNSISFTSTRKSVYKTESPGVYKLKARLRLNPSFADNVSPRRYSRYGSYYRNYNGSYSEESRQLSFVLDGYFSESSGKLCMVGSASWFSKNGGAAYLEGVLKLHFAKKSSSVFSSLVNGSLQSLSSSEDPRFFEPVKILAITPVESYNFSLASKDLGAVCNGGVDTPKDQSLSVSPKQICSVFWGRYGSFELERARGCDPSKNCSPFDGVLGHSPRFMSMNVIQCSDEDKKLRYMIRFQNTSYDPNYYKGFDPNTTLVGEGSWDEKKNRLCIIACRISADARVGNCSLRLSLRLPAVWTIKNNSRIAGEMWTNETAKDSAGYFEMMKFESTDRDMNGYYYDLPDLKYEYTETKRLKELCSSKMEAKEGETYPDGNSHDMRFDFSVTNHEKDNSWGDATPIFVGNEPFENYYTIEAIDDTGSSTVGVESREKTASSIRPLNMSYLISFNAFFTSKKSASTLDLSLNSRGRVEIVAEGSYNPKTGLLCMVGCRKVESKVPGQRHSLDCEIFVHFEYPLVNSLSRNMINGSIQSQRKKNDPLYFPDLKLTSNAFYTNQAKESIWRMDLEIVMVLITNTLACVFIVLQILHSKSHPETLPLASLTMLSALGLGLMIPLILNFKALFSNARQHQQMAIEVNEVVVRVVTMVAFLLQARLLQQAWTSRLANGDQNGNNLWVCEKRTIFVTLPLYLAGGLLTLFLMKSETLWGGLRSYAGLILDGFLLPQIILNIFRNSPRQEHVLSSWFYLGTTLVRLLPHAYDLYRFRNYVEMDVEGAYLYANPRGDFYSTGWDIVIPCGGLVLALIVWLQQRFGGCCFLPRRFRDSVVYQKVPTVSSSA